MLKAGWTDDPRAAERFLREARRAARPKHTSTVTVDDVGSSRKDNVVVVITRMQTLTVWTETVVL